MGTDPFLTAGVATGQHDPAVAARWAAAVYQATRETGGRVNGPIMEPAAGRNHYAVRIQLGDGVRLRLMLNATIGLVAAADDTDPHTLVAEFRDVPRPDVFGLAGFQVATADDMQEELTDQQAADLAEGELKDVAYHRPPRIGDVVFNWFD